MPLAQVFMLRRFALRPEGAATNQPRATPWVEDMNNNLASPERAKQACRQPRKLLSSNPCEVGCVIVPPRQHDVRREQPPDFLSMLTVADALAAVLAEARPLHPQTCLLHEAQGSVLAEDVRADADSPPFDKALVDGYAVRTADLDGPIPRSPSAS